MSASLIQKVAFTACALLFFCGCAAENPGTSSAYSTAYLGPNGEILFKNSPAANRPTPTPQAKWTWSGDDVPGKPSIVINLSEQSAKFYKGGAQVGYAPVSTGREGYCTPTGTFSVIEKSRDHISSLYGDYVDSGGEVLVRNVDVNHDKCPRGAHFQGAPMPYFLRITNGVGMHAGYLPGYAASHGCIRLPHEAAEIFFGNAPLGTPVRIVH